MKIERKRLSIKELPEQERPREKLITEGEATLTDAELLAIILASGTRAESALQLAQRILTNAGDLKGLRSLSVAELCRDFPGVGPARAAQIKAALELSRRIANEDTNHRSRFSNSQMVFAHFQPMFQGRDQEEFWMVALDAKNGLLKKVLVTKGTLMGSLAHPREIFRAAIQHSAAGVIILHNHPSGDPNPSAEDRKVTVQVAEAGKILGIPLLDHVIIGNSSYFSFKDAGML